MNQKYAVSYFEAPNCQELVDQINEFYVINHHISVRDVAYLSEMRASRLNPQQATVIFVCIITYKITYKIEQHPVSLGDVN